jgi:hypothetical protein
MRLVGGKNEKSRTIEIYVQNRRRRNIRQEERLLIISCARIVGHPLPM